MTEFDAIARYFRWPTPKATLGPGDDAALLSVPTGQTLAVSSDMLVQGRHFFANVDPYALGHKALAVNLSDLAAMGAQPVAFTLALALPELQPTWLAPLAQGMQALAQAHGCELIGGDTTAGPLTINITVFGHVPARQALRRDRAQIGDDIYVSGHLGDARLALLHRLGRWPEPLDQAAQTEVSARMDRPNPRVALGLALRGVAHAAMDLSDGLAGDIQHILRSSGVGARIHLDHLPLSSVLQDMPPAAAQELAANGGDDYELLFTATPDVRDVVAQIGIQVGLPITRIGAIEAAMGLRLLDAEGRDQSAQFHGFDHFALDC
jgi:thiamine-monophosphate kinase